MPIEGPLQPSHIAHDNLLRVEQIEEKMKGISDVKELNLSSASSDYQASDGQSIVQESGRVEDHTPAAESTGPGAPENTRGELDGSVEAKVTEQLEREDGIPDSSQVDTDSEEPAEPDDKIVDSSESEFELGEDVYREIRGRRALTNRRKEAARKRLLQATSYAALIEDRIVELERQLEKVYRKLDKEEAKDDAAPATTPPEDPEAKTRQAEKALSHGASKLMYEDFETPGRTHVVDLLIERPKIRRGWHDGNVRPTRRRRQRNKSVANSAGQKEKQRVERLRINSKSLCDVMEDVMGKDVAPRPGEPVLRPFKALFAYHEDLLKRRDELKAELQEHAAQSLDAQDPSPVADANADADADADAGAGTGAANATASGVTVSGANPPSESTAPSEEGVEDEKRVTQPADEPVEDTADATRKDEPAESKVDGEDAKPHVDRQLTYDHLQALLSIIDNELKDDLALHRKYRQRDASAPKIHFDNLWHLFAPGDIIYSAGQAQAYQVLRVHNGRELMAPDAASEKSKGAEAVDGSKAFISLDTIVKNPFVIDYFGIGFNGKEFGPVMSKLSIDPFDAEKDITSLELYPVEYGLPRNSSALYRTMGIATLNESMPLRDALIDRGIKCRDLASVQHAQHCSYRGMTVDVVPELVDSNVIIDTDCYYETHTKELPKLGLTALTNGDGREIQELCGCGDISCTVMAVVFHDDRKVEEERTTTFAEDHLGWLNEVGNLGKGFKDDQLCLLPGTLPGFVLYSREWRLLDVNKIQHVNRSTDSFQQLQIKPEYRKLVESQVKMHSTGVRPTQALTDAMDDRREDLVRGKGKGLIILLHGAPGVGKTSTAECIAEYTNRPLLSITCGDIGDTPETVQKNLDYYLNLAHRWGCVMLLDEADVFLSSRDKHDMQRNAVVSVFLRILEYYSGILFLTTNKIGAVDDAFKSRIHLSLHYPPLDEDQTTAIWSINIERIKKNRPGIKIDEKTVMLWAARQWHSCIQKRQQRWNGRQIRNACQTAAALAEFDNKGQVTVDHLNAVANASQDFDKYLRNLHGGDDAFRAKKNRDRRDDLYMSSTTAKTVQYGYDDRGPPDIYSDRYERDSYERDSYEGDSYDDHLYGPPTPRDNRRQSTYGSRRPQENRYDDGYDSNKGYFARPGNSYEDSSSGCRRDDREYDRAPRGYEDSPSDRARDAHDMPPPPRPTAPRRESVGRNGPRTESRPVNGRADSRSGTRDRDSERDRYR